MKAVIQRVTRASVEVEGEVIGRIDVGLLVLLGIAKEDTEADVRYVADKLVGLRIFSDAEGKMNRSIIDVGGQVLIVSQFTLLADTAKGRRPGFERAALPERALNCMRRSSVWCAIAGSMWNPADSARTCACRWIMTAR